LLGFVGRLSPEKGPDVFLRALGLLQAREPRAHAVLVGEGPMEPELRALAARLGLGERLHFAGLQEDMPAVYNELDAVVSTSHTEAMPLALMEAMASGLPVVATRVGGVPDIVEHERTGWLVAPGDAGDIAGRCAALAADASLRRQMGERGRQRVVQQFDLADSVERVGQLLARLAQPRADGPRRVPALAADSTGTTG
jgi:glycosyltransferase involved in cell wall biosynthesis